MLRVLPSGRWLPRNQGWVNFWETRLVTVMKSLHRSCWTELTCQGIFPAASQDIGWIINLLAGTCLLGSSGLSLFLASKQCLEIYSAWLMIYSLDARQMSVSWGLCSFISCRFKPQETIPRKTNGFQLPRVLMSKGSHCYQVLAKEKKKDSEH